MQVVPNSLFLLNKLLLLGKVTSMPPNSLKSIPGLSVKCFLLVIIFLLLISYPPVIQGAFYKYIDENGNIHFVDQKAKIPDKYRKELTVYPEKYDNLPEEERERLIERDRRAIEEKRRLQREKKEEEKLLREQAEKERIELEKKRKEEELAEQTIETKVAIAGNQVLVPVRLSYNDKEVQARLLLDTGASTVLLHEDLAKQLIIGETRRAVGYVAGGESITADFTKLDYLIAGPYKMENITVAIVKQNGPQVPFQGLLGMNFLRGLSYSVDFEKQVLRWDLSKAKLD